MLRRSVMRERRAVRLPLVTVSALVIRRSACDHQELDAARRQFTMRPLAIERQSGPPRGAQRRPVGNYAASDWLYAPPRLGSRVLRSDSGRSLVPGELQQLKLTTGRFMRRRLACKFRATRKLFTACKKIVSYA